MAERFTCEDPGVLANRVRGILEKVSGLEISSYSSHQVVEYEDTAYGHQFLVRLSWVSGQLQDEGVHVTHADQKVIEMLGFHDGEGQLFEFYLHKEGIHLHKHLNLMPDEGHVQGIDA